MVTERVERRLSAILAADVARFSRLMGSDEEGTLAQLKAHRRTLVDPKIAEYGGRIVKTTGDGLLVEFASVVDAVRCSADVQRGMIERNADVLQEKRIEFRIGINVGDIIIEGGDIFGDGVNVAARLEGIAEPGGICLSRAAYDQVRGKIDVAARDLGERRLKNIAEPVRVYAISPTARASPLPHTTRVSRLSIVVLPLANLGGDSEHDYFVDGITESLTTDLSRIPGAFVIARNTAFTYKGKTIDVRQVGEELGIRYALGGSVQRSGTRLRVNVELIDTESGGHLWAERFDRDTGELFDIQDEIVARVARALDVELTAAEARRAERGYAADLDSIDFTFRGYAAFNRSLSPENLSEADQFFETALTLDPRNAQALVGRALARLAFASSYTRDERATHLATAETAAIQALALAPNYAKAHRALGEIYIYTNRTMLGIAEVEQAIALDRNHAHAYAMLGLAQVTLGHAEEAEGRIAQAFRLSPRDAFAYLWCTNAGAAKLLLGRDDEALVWLGRAIEANRTYPLTHFLLAAALAQQGQAAKARIATAAGLALNPTFTIRRYRQGALSDNPTHLAQRERVIEGLRRAAVPEE